MVIEAAAALFMIVAIACGGLWVHAVARLRASLWSLAALELNRAEAESAARAAGEEIERLRETLDAVPMPVWRRDRGGRLVDCNLAYAASLGAAREEVLAEARELIPAGNGDAVGAAANMVRLAGSRSEQAHVVIGGQRRLLDLVEAPCAAGGMIGFARDYTDVEAARAELWRHVNANADVLESIYAAVAIFGPDRKLTFFNHAFASLWAIEEACMAGEPTLGEILERLRESRRLPEFADFRAFKRERCALFTSLIEPRHELMHLPDGRTLQLTVSPHPFGGLTFVYEDVSDRLALECSYNTLIQVSSDSPWHSPCHSLFAADFWDFGAKPLTPKGAVW
jgi:PAS domain-containing protein